MRNLRLAFRTLFKTPFVTIVAALSLALGIGANTAIFSLFDQMLRRPLPVHQPDRLVNITSPGVMSGSNSCNQAGSCQEIWSYPMFKDLEKSPAQFASVAGHVQIGANIAFEGQTMNGGAMLVSGRYFQTLGIQPHLGRFIGPADDETPGAHPVAVLSHSFWSTRLGADSSVVGKTMMVNGTGLTILGVGPEGFDGTTMGSRPFVFVPISMRNVMLSVPQSRTLENRRSYWVYAFARLKDGVSMEEAARAINAVYKPILLNVEVPLQEGMSDQTLGRFKTKEVVVKDGRRGQSSMHNEASTPLILLFAVTGVVLLIACANIANLLLARAANRSMEMAVRLSLGGSRKQLITQLLTESVVLAGIGGVVSIVVAYWTINGITAMLPDDAVETLTLSLSVPAIVFAFALALITGLIFGMFPAIHSTRPDLVTALRNNSGKLAGGRGAARFRTSLVTAQIALSMSLLMFAGLFIKSLSNVSRVDLGLRTENIVTFAVSPGRNAYDSTRSKVLYQRMQDEIMAIPGVTSVTAGTVPLLSGSNWGNNVRVQGFPEGPDVDNNSRFNIVGTDYFTTFNMKLLAGREFTAADDRGRPLVAVVNETFAKKFGLGREAVGKLMTRNDTGRYDIEIVGLVQDAKYSEVKDTIPPQFFIPYRQESTVGRLNFYVKTSGDAIQLLRAIPPVMKRLDADLPVEELKTLTQQVRENTFLDRMISILSSSFAFLATLLASVGLYGVLAYSVAQRTREIGVRMALGASEGKVRSMVLRQVAMMTVIGGIIGLAAAVGLGRKASSLMYELKSHDPLVMAGAVLLLTAVALAAGYIPARRASQVDPMQALRYE
jgi:predicted permease